MKCQECEAENKKSSVYPGMSMSTSMGYHQYYDEDGRYHDHDPNFTTTGYRCSNGHEWKEHYRSKCWCGK